MSSYCTYTVYAKVPDEDGGGERAVPCGKDRVGEVVGPVRVVLCKRHYAVVARAVADDPEHRLILDQPQGEMAASDG